MAKKPAKESITFNIGVSLTQTERIRYRQLSEKLMEMRGSPRERRRDPKRKIPKKLSCMAREAILNLMDKVEEQLKSWS